MDGQSRFVASVIVNVYYILRFYCCYSVQTFITLTALVNSKTLHFDTGGCATCHVTTRVCP